MSLKERIDSDLKQAMKARDKPRLDCLRMLKSKILEQEKASRGDEAAAPLTDEETQAVVTTYAKQRRDSITSYREGGREDLARQEEAELAIVGEYLPRQLSEEEVRKIVAEAIEESGASSPRDLGAVMKLAMPRVKGAADGKQVNRIARELIAGD